MKFRSALYIGLLLIVFVAPVRAGAHGATITYKSNVEIQITASDNDGLMDNAQVAIYAPDDRTKVWLEGTTDENGKFSFAPDTTKVGLSWLIRITKDAHSHILNVTAGENVSVSGGIGGFSTLQIVLMSVCVGWGFVGTALYFRRKRAANAHS
jgi:nickel transport protein